MHALLTRGLHVQPACSDFSMRAGPAAAGQQLQQLHLLCTTHMTSEQAAADTSIWIMFRFRSDIISLRICCQFCLCYWDNFSAFLFYRSDVVWGE